MDIMNISFNPRISGKFTDYVLGDNNVKDIIEENFPEVPKELLHELAKSILIKGFTCFEVDINSIINNLKKD